MHVLDLMISWDILHEARLIQTLYTYMSAPMALESCRCGERGTDWQISMYCGRRPTGELVFQTCFAAQLETYSSIVTDMLRTCWPFCTVNVGPFSLFDLQPVTLGYLSFAAFQVRSIATKRRFRSQKSGGLSVCDAIGPFARPD